MLPTVLATKLYIPHFRSELVKRSRLTERLNLGLSRGSKVTLVSAPAGFGKTSLISEWVQTCGRHTAWFSVEEADNDPIRFLTYIVTAFQTLFTDFGKGILETLNSTPNVSVESILTLLLNELSGLTQEIMLVLDDYHIIDEPMIDRAVEFFILHLPPQIHMVIATREDPMLPLAGLRARGQLNELRVADLRFTTKEAADFLNRMMGLNLSTAEIAALEERTEGWIAGLQLAALSVQGREDIQGFIQAFTGSHRFVLDYLAEEVLQRQTESTRSFLVQTSILDTFNAPLCDAILERKDGKLVLEGLERSNLFLIPLDDQREWFRFHHLFSDFLRARLAESEPSRVRILHQRAGDWYESNQLHADAFRHILASGDHQRAADLAEDAWQGMERYFLSAAWLSWVKKLPEEVVYSRPRLCVLVGWAYADAGYADLSEDYLRTAERLLCDQRETKTIEPLGANIALIRANNAQNQGDLAGSVKFAQECLRLLPEGEIYLRAQAVITLEFTHWAAGDLEASLQAMYAWIADMKRLGNEVFAVASAFAVADMQMILGRLSDAEKTLWQAINQAAGLGKEAEYVTAHHHLGLALIAHERCDDTAAREQFERAASLGKNSTLVDWPNRWCLAQARLREADRKWGEALELYDDAERVYVQNPIPLFQPMKARKARVFLKQGRLGEAQAWASDRGLAVEEAASYMREYELLTYVRIRLAARTFAGVNDLLNRLLTLADTQKRIGSMIEILISQALAWHAQGNLTAALVALKRALELGEREGYKRIFLYEGELLHELLQELKARQNKPSNHPQAVTVEELLVLFTHSPSCDVRAPRNNQPAELIEPLTDRELEILRLMALGLSNNEISQRLFLALSTIKGHNMRLFDKLQVKNRAEAAHRARALGLLS